MEYLVLVMAVWLLFGLLTVQAFESEVDEKFEFWEQAVAVSIWPVVITLLAIRWLIIRSEK